MSKVKQYVNNPDFLKAIIAHREKCKLAIEKGEPKPKLPNYIGECWMKIAEGLSHKPNFINYPFREEMISDGIVNCLQYHENFDPAKTSNPFAYFTQIIYYAFLRRIQKEKDQLYIRYKAKQFGVIDEFQENMEEFDHTGLKQVELYDNMLEFIDNFENTKKEKKLATKKSNSKSKGIEQFISEV